jgi:nicotinamidase/pyrazinamidase
MARLPDSALIVVDLQRDFLPGGALAIAGADRVLAPLAALMRVGVFATIVATQDWHPANHVSFASQHPPHRPFDTITLYGRPQTLWPDHCIAGSKGAELDSGLPWEQACAIVRKGMDRAVDSYSGFRNNHDAQGIRPPTGLGGYLREAGVRSVYVCGLARDVCVLATAEDASALGFETTVLWDLTQPVVPESDTATRQALGRAGVSIVDSAALMA